MPEKCNRSALVFRSKPLLPPRKPWPRIRRHPLAQLALIAAVAIFASLIGGVAGYGTGALMPLVLVPIVGAEPGPIIAMSALFTNLSRSTAFRKSSIFAVH